VRIGDKHKNYLYFKFTYYKLELNKIVKIRGEELFGVDICCKLGYQALLR